MEAGSLALTQVKDATLQHDSEAALLDACRRQDVAAFETLYRQHGSKMKSVAYHVVGNRQDAEDAVQDAFVKAFKSIGGFRGDSSIGGWLCRIVINASYDVLRKRQRETALIAEPERSGPCSSMRMAINQAMKRLNPKHRMVFMLYEVEGLKHTEVAAAMDIPEGTSKAWLFEAKRELKRMLSEVQK